MLVELGCRAPAAKIRHDDPQRRPVVVYSVIPDSYSFPEGDIDTEDFRKHLTSSVMTRKGITSYPGAEALLPLTHPTMGAWPEVSDEAPTFVWSDNKNLQRFLSEYHQCPEERPANYDGDYWRRSGFASGRLLAPGVLAYAAEPPVALVTNVGINNIANRIANSSALTGKGSAATSSTFTTNLTLTTNAWAGGVIYAADTTNNQVVYGIIVSNNNTSNASVVTVDQWYNAATPGGSAATTPAAGFEFILTFATPGAYFMGITGTNITPAATDTSLSGELTSNGLARKIATYTVTSAASGGSITYTLSAVYTYTGSSNQTVYACGFFCSNVKTDTTDTMEWETSFAGSATVSNNGDQLTATDTYTAS